MYQEWYPNGQPKADCSYDHGRRIGPYTEWYDNGRKRVFGTYAAEGKDGLWITWDKAGLITSQQRFKAGKSVPQ